MAIPTVLPSHVTSDVEVRVARLPAPGRLSHLTLRGRVTSVDQGLGTALGPRRIFPFQRAVEH